MNWLSAVTRPAPRLIRLVADDGGLEAWIAPDRGGELAGLRARHRDAMHELLYRGLDFADTPGWGGHAPLLWPAIGRTYFPGDRPTSADYRDIPLGWALDGQSYPMPQHGFVRALPWTVECQSEDAATVVLEDSARSRHWYPFGFRLALTYTVASGSLRLHLTISAAAANDRPMPFTLGNHITFRQPLASATGPLSTIQTDARRRWPLDAVGCPAGEPVPDRSLNDPMTLRTYPPNSVRVMGDFGAGDARATLEDPDGLSVSVSHALLSCAGAPEPFIAFWGVPDDGYMCLEPWLGLPNALSSRSGLAWLDPGQTAIWTMLVEVKAQP